MNANCLPNKLVPKAKRLSIYKQVLELLSSEQENKAKSSGLCINLPMVLWGLNHHLENAPNGEDWDFFDTPNMFPEIKNYLNSIIIIDGFKGRIERRKEVLKEIINSLESSN